LLSLVLLAANMAGSPRARRDRPFYTPRRSERLQIGMRDDDEEFEETEDTWCYRVVLKRVSDLLKDDKDTRRVRRLLEEHIGVALDCFCYYCQLGDQAMPDGTQRFVAIEPHRLHWRRLARGGALEEFCALWVAGPAQPTQPDDLGVRGRPQPEVAIPQALLTMRQVVRLITQGVLGAL
jgi:hypothetical protein